MSCQEVEEFGRVLVREVRDAAIQDCDMARRPTAMGAMAKRWRELAKTSPVKPVAEMLIPDIVDRTLCALLRALDDGKLPLSFTTANGKKVDFAEEGLGELVGWYLGDWRFDFSSERGIDDAAKFRTWPPPPLPEEARRVLDREDPPAET